MVTKDTNRRLIERNESWPSYPDGTLVMTGDNVQIANGLGWWRDETVEGIEFRRDMNGKQFVKISYKSGIFSCDSAIDMPSNILSDGKPAHIGDKVKHVKCSDVMEVVCNSFGEVFVRDSNGSEYYVNPDSLVHVVHDSVDKLIKDLEIASCCLLPSCGYFCHTAEDGQQSCDHCPSADVSDKTCSQVFIEDVAKRIKELMKGGVE